MSIKEFATYRAKETTARASLLALGVAFELGTRFSAALRNEIADIPEGRTFAIGILPDGPAISLRKEGSGMRYLGWGMNEPDVAVLYKNIDAALMNFLGQIGTHHAGAQRRFIVRGNLGDTMVLARALNIVQTFLFPAMYLDLTAKRPVQLSGAELLAKARVMSLLGPALALNATKKVR